MSIFDFLNPVKALADTARGIIGMFVTDPSKKLEFEQQIASQQAVLEAQALDAAKASVVAEEQGSIWIQKAWRPLVSMGLFVILLYSGPIVSLFHLPQISMAGVPPELWSTFKLCVGGYMGLRTVDKAAEGYFRSKNGNGNGSNGH